MWIHAVTLAAASIGWAPVQDNADSIFQKAQVLESVQGDLASAARAYERVVMLSPDGDLAIRASYRLGLIWKQLGKEEAANAALERAATGEGELAVRAQEILNGAPIGSQDRLAKQVDELLEGVRGGLNESIAEGFRIIGPEAVPFIVRSIERSEDLLYIGRAASVMMMLGGPDAVQFFEKVAASEDAVLKRAVLASAELGMTKEVAEVLRRFLNDEDESVAIRAFDLPKPQQGGEFLSREECLQLVEPSRPDLAERVLDKIGASAWASPNELRTAYDRLTKSALREATEKALARVFAGSRAAANSRSAGELYLVLLADPKAPGPDLWWRSNTIFQFQHATAVAPLDKVMQAARSLSDADFEAAGKSRRALEGYIKGALRFLFDDESKDVVFELVRLGYADAVDSWLTSHPDEVTFEILKLTLDRLPDAVDFFSTLRDANWQPRPDEVDAFVDWFESRSDWPTIPIPERALTFAVQACLLAGTERSTLAVVDFVTEQPGYFRWVAENLVRYRTAESGEAIYRLMVSPLDGLELQSVERSQFDQWRNVLFLVALRIGDERHLGDFAKAYQLGLWPPNFGISEVELGEGLGKISQYAQIYRPTGLSWFAMRAEDGQPIEGFDSEAERQLVAACLAPDAAPRAWADVASAFQWTTQGDVSVPFLKSLPLGFVQGVADRMMEAPESEMSSWTLRSVLTDDRLPLERRREILDWALGLHTVSLVQAALDQVEALLPKEEIARRLEPLLEMCQGNLFEKLGPQAGPGTQEYMAFGSFVRDVCRIYLKVTSDSERAIGEIIEVIRANPTEKFQQAALYALWTGLPHDVFARHAKEILETANAAVRVSVVQYFRIYLRLQQDPAALSLLVSAYQDEDARVRTAAQEALDELRTYRETIGFWERVQKGTELNQQSAAQALIEQARDESKPIEIRVTAIRSLGTLGLAESLPILIGWLDSDNEQIREAAKAAIEKINR